MHWSKGRLLISCTYHILPVIVFASIWFPLIAHYFVPNIVITEEMIDRARRVPTDSVLGEIERFFRSPDEKETNELINSAEMALQGKWLLSTGMNCR